ncbi:tRNA pseudouridine(55) synthase TruB [Leptodesmis sichuanensis]|uniref:tRNA pseudouridine(55) synthase TruB n=1 Tax=Leptodesmis sichuanensis TaxID=2906798 RepID=UPI001F418155|nr:tRNA pseudouridine(55) synthase TruB [Leptodesmis sichuanensis]UIE40274.1 tRNA pseudouridine(55) synthase TruB [Leptodesmis sichuanensis A121]
MHGFLNLNKPKNLTSHDCVAKVRRMLKMKRVGHAGTLDPAATGVLPIALGQATRLLQFLPQDKAYRATIRLGVCTTTDDLEGAVLQQQPASHLDLETVRTALQTFQGSIQQIPPNYSAIQVQGQRLYDLARQGKDIEVQAREVEVHSIQILAWRSGEFPEIEVEIACGPGTYIRAIARDLGQVLRTGGTLVSLLRTASSGFRLEDSLTLAEVEQQSQQGTFQPIAPEVALRHLGAIVLPPPLARRWLQGQRIDVSKDLPEWVPTIEKLLRVHQEDGNFLGIGQAVNTETAAVILRPQVVLQAPS